MLVAWKPFPKSLLIGSKMEKENESIGFFQYFINILSSQTENYSRFTAIGFDIMGF
jgi:hypothetical protein